jgi:amino acid transporter
VAGGFINYGNVLLESVIGRPISPVLLATIAVAASTWIAYRDVKLSAQVMLWIEAASLCLIGCVVLILLGKFGFHFDPAQLRLRGVSTSQVRLGLVLALFSFVGFESATTLGSEAKDPLRTIPRAVIQSAILAGMIFILCAYTEVLGFHSAGQDLGQSRAPLHVLAKEAGIPVLGPLIDVGALVSMFACTLGCITASGRVLMMMAHGGLIPSRMARTHRLNATPGEAVILAGALQFLLVGGLAAKGVSGADIYGWMGSLATYGFLTVYAQVAIALPFYLQRKGHLTRAMMALSIATAVAMVLALIGTVYPLPEAPYDILPYFYLAYLAIGLLAFAISRRKSVRAA